MSKKLIGLNCNIQIPYEIDFLKLLSKNIVFIPQELEDGTYQLPLKYSLTDFKGNILIEFDGKNHKINSDYSIKNISQPIPQNINSGQCFSLLTLPKERKLFALKYLSPHQLEIESDFISLRHNIFVEGNTLIIEAFIPESNGMNALKD